MVLWSAVRPLTLMGAIGLFCAAWGVLACLKKILACVFVVFGCVLPAHGVSKKSARVWEHFSPQCGVLLPGRRAFTSDGSGHTYRPHSPLLPSPLRQSGDIRHIKSSVWRMEGRAWDRDEAVAAAAAAAPSLSAPLLERDAVRFADPDH